MLCTVAAASAELLGSSRVTEIELGQTVTGETPGAYYKIALDEPGSYVVNMESVPGDMLTSIKVSGDAGIDFAAETQTSAPGELASLTLEIADPGIYYIEISELEGKECGPYTFNVVPYSGSKLWLDPF